MRQEPDAERPTAMEDNRIAAGLATIGLATIRVDAVE